MSTGKMVIGLDLSLSGAAACAIPVDWDGARLDAVRTCVFGYSLTKDATDLQRLERFHAIASGMVDFCNHFRLMPIIFVEQYAFSQSGAMASEIRECGGIVKYRLWRKLGIVVTPVVAASARKTLLNKCPRKDVKKFVVRNVRRLEGSAREWSEDEVDAFVIANHGMMLSDLVAMNFDGE